MLDLDAIRANHADQTAYREYLTRPDWEECHHDRGILLAAMDARDEEIVRLEREANNAAGVISAAVDKINERDKEILRLNRAINGFRATIPSGSLSIKEHDKVVARLSRSPRYKRS